MQTIHLDDENTKSRLVSTIRLKIQEQKRKIHVYGELRCYVNVTMSCTAFPLDQKYKHSLTSLLSRIETSFGAVTKSLLIGSWQF